MADFDEKMIRETAYYIWKNNGCPANTSAQDWKAAIEWLDRRDAVATANKVSAMYKNCTLLPDLKLNFHKAGAKNIKNIPYLLTKTFGAAPAARKTVKKSK